jgi:hypothetical protein
LSFVGCGIFHQERLSPHQSAYSSLTGVASRAKLAVVSSTIGARQGLGLGKFRAGKGGRQRCSQVKFI